MLRINADAAVAVELSCRGLSEQSAQTLGKYRRDLQ